MTSKKQIPKSVTPIQPLYRQDYEEIIDGRESDIVFRTFRISRTQILTFVGIEKK